MHLFAMILFVLSCNSPKEIKIHTGTIEQALANAAKDNKKLMVITTNTNCPPCEIYLSEILKNKKYNKLFSHYIIYQFDSSNPLNQWIEQWMYEKTYPVTSIFSSKGNLITIIKQGNLDKIAKVLNKIESNPTDTSVYSYCNTQLKLRGKALVAVLNPAFKSYILLHKQGELQKEQMHKAISDIKKNLNQESYFFNNYLLAKMYNKLKDTVAANIYVQTALEFNGTLDAVIYPSLRAELKFQSNERYDKYDDAYLSVNTTEYQMGKIERSSQPKAVFRIRNEGKKPLIIQNIVVSCNCTSSKWSKKPIMPGKESEITLTYNASTEGQFQQVAYIISNAFNSSVTISIKGYSL